MAEDVHQAEAEGHDKGNLPDAVWQSMIIHSERKHMWDLWKKAQLLVRCPHCHRSQHHTCDRTWKAISQWVHMG